MRLSDARHHGVRAALAMAAAFSLSGCGSMYVDGGMPEVPVSQFKKPAVPHSAQVLFEFQTRGVANARATQLLKTQVLEQVRTSGLFSEVSESPVASGALLGVTLNNVPISEDAAMKGFFTGMTFGLAGSQVSDGYICTATYTAGPGAASIVKTAGHAIHTTVGATSAPQNAVKANDAQHAAELMTRQIVSRVLNELSRDGGFQ